MRLLLGVLLSSIVLPIVGHAQLPSAAVGVSQPNVDARAIAKTLAARLVSDFVYPEQAARYAATLKANADAGVYDALKGAALAAKLTDDLQAIARDGHLRVMFQGMGGGGGPKIVIKRPPDSAGGAASPGPQPKMIRMVPPPEMEQGRWIAPGIAFVRFNLFPGGPKATEAARKFMATHANARVIIFDLRTHMGGGLDEMDAIFPWLFAQPTRLVTMATRKSVDEAGGSPIAGVPTLRVVQADPNFITREHWVTPGQDKRLNSAKVFVLTSGFTGSAAEHFALAFKQTKRGMLIGSKTYGANHFGSDQDLGGDYTAFIPVGRAYDPVTGKDWEGVGVAPDIEVAPKDALVKALTLSGVSPAKAAELSAELAPKMPMIG
jgi:Peptidase family S41